MSSDSSDDKGKLEKIERQIDVEIDPKPGNNLTIYGEHININRSSLDALKEIAAANPEIASKIVDASREAVSSDTKRYTVGAVAAATIASVMLAGSAGIIIWQGLLAGLAFFLTCAAVASIYSAIFTGKALPLDWVVGFWRSARGESDN